MAGQVNATAGAVATEKVLMQVTGGSQLLVAVNVTDAVPPQADGMPALLLVSTVPHPPEAIALASQVLYLLLIVVWV